ncbi:MAG: OmpA family protein [Lautropia sp.]|nr:OmpA family protein [Lautropia sp.]
MTQQDDDTTRTGLWVVFATVAALLIGLIIWVLKEVGISSPPTGTDTKALTVGANPSSGHEQASTAAAATAASSNAAANTEASARPQVTDSTPTAADDTGHTAANNPVQPPAETTSGGTSGAQDETSATQIQAAAAGAEATADEFVAFDNLNSGELSAVVHFASASAVLPTDTSAEIAALVDMLQANESRRVVVAGFHDPTGNAAFNDQLARKRAFAVRDALIAQGISRERIIMRKPEQTTGTGTLAEARRVELRLID